MNFAEMLVMIGPSGIACAHSQFIANDDERLIPKNNHWCRSSSGKLVARAGGYIKDTEIFSQSDYESGAQPPPVCQMLGGKVCLYTPSSDDIRASWEIAELPVST